MMSASFFINEIDTFDLGIVPALDDVDIDIASLRFSFVFSNQFV